MKFYTYAHYTKDTNELFYIGKGTNNKKNRHLQTQNRNRWWHAKVKKHGGFTSEILAYWETEAEALDHEKFLIDCFENIRFVLVNIWKARGKEAAGKKLSAEVRQKYSAASKKKWELLDKDAKEQWREKISTAVKGKPKTEKHKQNLSKARTGIKVPSMWKPIKCLTTGVVYSSLTEASLKTGCDPSHITKCCRGKLKKTKNMEFVYG